MLFGLCATTLTTIANILIPIGGALVAVQPVVDAAKQQRDDKKG